MWFFPLTLENRMLCHVNPSANFIKTLARSRSNACTLDISLSGHRNYLLAELTTEIRVSAEFTAFRRDRDAARSVI